MALTQDELARALRLRAGPGSLDADVQANVIGILSAATCLIEEFAPTAPEAVKDEATVRIASRLYDQPGADARGVNPVVASGAAHLLAPWRARRVAGAAGTVAGGTTTTAGLDTDAVLDLMAAALASGSNVAIVRVGDQFVISATGSISSHDQVARDNAAAAAAAAAAASTEAAAATTTATGAQSTADSAAAAAGAAQGEVDALETVVAGLEAAPAGGITAAQVHTRTFTGNGSPGQFDTSNRVTQAVGYTIPAGRLLQFRTRRASGGAAEVSWKSPLLLSDTIRAFGASSTGSSVLNDDHAYQSATIGKFAGGRIRIGRDGSYGLLVSFDTARNSSMRFDVLEVG